MYSLTCCHQYLLLLVTKLCLTLCNLMDCSLKGSSVHGILQARILECRCRFLLQGIFPTQGSNPCLLHWQGNYFPLRHQASLQEGRKSKVKEMKEMNKFISLKNEEKLPGGMTREMIFKIREMEIIWLGRDSIKYPSKGNSWQKWKWGKT